MPPLTVSNAMIEDAARLLSSVDDILLTTHITPDGDGIGSELACLRFLKSIGKRATAVNCSSVPPDLRFLCRDGEVITFTKERHTAALASAGAIVAFDLGGAKRLGRMEDPIRASTARKVLIDHHIYENDLFDVPVIDTSVCASAELTYNLILAMGGKIGLDLAEPLYVGVVSDTGSFSFNATTPHTHELAAEFLRHGVNPHRIWKRLVCHKAIARIRLLGLILATIDTCLDGRIAWTKVDFDFLKRQGAEARDTFDAVAHLLTIQGVEVGVFFLEVGSTRTKVSLRSAGRVDVSGLAKRHGGGGHRFAAGCTVDGLPFSEAISMILDSVAALVRGSGSAPEAHREREP